MQKVKAEKEKQRSYRAVVHLADKRFVQLANKTMPVVITNDNAQFALGSAIYLIRFCNHGILYITTPMHWICKLAKVSP